MAQFLRASNLTLRCSTFSRINKKKDSFSWLSRLVALSILLNQVTGAQIDSLIHEVHICSSYCASKQTVQTQTLVLYVATMPWHRWVEFTREQDARLNLWRLSRRSVGLVIQHMRTGWGQNSVLASIWRQTRCLRSVCLCLVFPCMQLNQQQKAQSSSCMTRKIIKQSKFLERRGRWKVW